MQAKRPRRGSSTKRGVIRFREIGRAALLLCALAGCAGAAPPAHGAAQGSVERSARANAAWQQLPKTSANASKPALLPSAPLAAAGGGGSVTTTPPFGTADPFVLVAAGKTGRWVAYCQARQDSDKSGAVEVTLLEQGRLAGDALRPYVFIVGQGELEVDALLANDQSGRFLVVQKAGRAVLVDSELLRSREFDASVDLRSDALPYADHRSFAFAPESARLLYVKRAPAGAALTLLDLTSGTERTEGLGDRALWRVGWAPREHWVMLQSILDDTNQNGRRGWPVPELPTPDPKCHGPIPRFATWLDRGDRPVTELLAALGGPIRTEPNFVAPFGEGFLSRRGDGQLRLERPGKSPVALAPADCNAHVAHVDPTRGLAVIGCVDEEPGTRPKLELVGIGYRKALGIDVATLAVDHWSERAERLVPFYPGRDAVLLDMDRRELLRLEPETAVLTTRDHLALLKRGQRLSVYDATTDNAEELTTELERFADVHVSGDFAFVGPFVVNWQSRKVLGRIEGRALALANDGRVLRALGRHGSGTEVAKGPLAWVEAH